MKDREVTLQEILNFRETKAMEQERLCHLYKDSVVIGLGMNIPGPIKRTPSVFHLFEDGMAKFEAIISQSGGVIKEKIIMNGHAGLAAVYSVTGTYAYVLKKKSISLENSHPCGRLFDIDIFNRYGSSIKREQIGFPKRKCLICNCDAKICGRSRAHSIQELTDHVWKMIESWEKQYDIK